MTCHQSIVWIDAEEACILRMEDGLQHEMTIRADGAGDPPIPPTDIAVSIDGSNVFFQEVARALDMADEILIVGPSTTKEEFVKYMHKNDHAIDPRILGVETIGHPSDTELAGFANLYFTVGGPHRSGNASGYTNNLLD